MYLNSKGIIAVIVTLIVLCLYLYNDNKVKNESHQRDIEFTKKLMDDGAPAPRHNGGVYRNYNDYEQQFKEDHNLPK